MSGCLCWYLFINLYIYFCKKLFFGACFGFCVYWLEFVWVFDGKTIGTFLEACGPLSPLFNGLACYWVYLGRMGLDGQLNPNSSFTILGLVSTLGMVSNLVRFKASLGWFGLGSGCQFYCREGWVGLVLVLTRNPIRFLTIYDFLDSRPAHY